ncbi:hypothetical protein PIB30_015311 [Stylosanthes scabra]|uniref:HAT C-terminal dimerisation domain-containing protein n=1 Tax=Stylosanthes scabra TaxID=79078 RepID=A0ABU6Z8R9_9FABA|nr:hypothetical protein [Stylosanthes scabra]
MNPKPPEDSQDVSMSSDFAAPSSNVETNDSDIIVFEDPMSKWKQTQKIKLSELKKNEMDRYLEDEVAEDYDRFDILRWWKGKTLSALSPVTMEALICTQNWLKPAKIIIPLEEGDQAVSSACSRVTTVGESEVQSSMAPPQSSLG